MLSVEVEAMPGSHFVGFTGACGGTDPCLITVDKALSVVAWFANDEGPSDGVTPVNYPGGATLPATGNDPWALGLIGGGVFLAGAALTLLGSRRYRRS